MNQFASAFRAWTDTHPQTSLRDLMKAADIDTSMLSRVRKGTHPITFDSLSRLLPVIEAHSSRLHALTLHLAYLADETVATYKDDIQITATDPLGQPQDVYDQLAADWVRRAKSDSNFWAMWAGIDSYMHHPDRLARQLDDDSSHLALVAETPATYHTGGSHGDHDPVTHDHRPLRHAADEQSDG